MPINTTMPNTDVDPLTGKKKPPAISAPTPGGGQAQTGQPATTTMPTVQGNQGLMQLTAQPGSLATTTPEQANATVLKTAQQSAVDNTAQNSPLSSLLQNKTTALVKDPNQGYGTDQYKQNQLDQYDIGAGGALKTLREQTADVGNTGQNAVDIQNLLLQNMEGRANLSTGLDKQINEQTTANLLNALSSGRAQEKQASDIGSANIGNLATVRGMAEGERSQTTGFENTKELETLGYGQDVQKMAIANGYDLNKLDKTFGHDVTMAAINQGYDLNKLDKTFGHDVTMAAINQGYDLLKMEVSFGNEIAKLITTSNLDTASKTSLMHLQDILESGQLVKKQDFEAIQNDLDRQEKIALQKGDIAGQLQIQTLRGEIDAKAQSAQNEFGRVERVATQSWQSGERISTQDYQAATNYFNQSQENARQANDIEGQKILAEMKIKTDLQMQTQDFSQQEKMAYINAQIAEAKAGGDVDREKTLISFQTTQDLEKMVRSGNIDQAKMELQSRIDEALNKNDFVRADALQTSRFVFEGTEKAKDRVIEQTKIDLSKKTAAFNDLFAAFEAGTISADSVLNVVKSAVKEYGIVVTPPDPMATEKEIIKEFEQTKLQFALTHPEYQERDQAGNIKLSGLPESLKAFNDFMNKTIYGSTGTEPGTSAETAITFNGIQRGNAGFVIEPPAEGATFKFSNGATYVRNPGNVGTYNGPQSFSAIDSSTFEQVQLIANHGIKYSSAPNLIFDPSISKADADMMMKNFAASPLSGDLIKLGGNLSGYKAEKWGSDYTISKV